MCAIKRQFSDNLDAFVQNVKMVVNLCRLPQDHPVARLFCSAAVYGEDIENTNIREESAICPTSYYGIEKYTSECLLRKAFEGRDQRWLFIMRPPLVYSPGD